MSKTTELFNQSFMLTSEASDPRDLDFKLFTHEKIVNNPSGDPLSKEYYMDYDMENEQFVNLAVKCRYTYVNQPVPKRLEFIEWFFADGTVGATRQLVQVIN